MHEVRDPIHTFIRFSDDERKIIDSRPFQRLRDIHQLAMTYMVYPGATHRRFEHSLGVMELASQIFDVVTNQENLRLGVFEEFRDELTNQRDYWRKVVRAAALCHDLGHLPFSHATEEGLLEKGVSHEVFSARLICEYMAEVFSDMRGGPQPEDVAKVALGRKEWQKAKSALGEKEGQKSALGDDDFSDWHAVLSEIITSDTLGADRMDYLLRDSHHTGVAYGKFDLGRMLSTMRILPTEQAGREVSPFALGMEKGGIHVAEAFLLARYFIYKQVYFHHVRRAYDIHLLEFMQGILGEKIRADGSLEEYLQLTDSAVFSRLTDDSTDSTKSAKKRILGRGHFRRLYERNTSDIKTEGGNPVKKIYDAACREFGKEAVRKDEYTPASGAKPDFSVLRDNDRGVDSCRTVSEMLDKIPATSFGFVFIDPEKRIDAGKWLEKNHDNLMEDNDQETKEDGRKDNE